MTAQAQLETPAWRTLVEQVVAAAGLELVQAELRGEGGGRLLRVMIDQPAGVGLGDCERVSRALSAALDQAEAEAPAQVLAGAYTLEVSSPGLNRPLVKPSDFERFAGQRAQIRVRAPGQAARSWTGLLLGAGPEGVRLHAQQGDQGEDVVLGWNQIERAQLAPQWPQPRRPGKKL
ncbi:MAG TPA: ribosome maturation factor RimP [Terriglobales bacterium]|nr:ribosome maturation factor RimP [Terriglobales bacterium]